MRGGSTPLISNCVAILNTRFPFNNDRSVIRETLNKEGCGLNDLKSHFNSVRLYTFGFSIRDLLDAGFTIYKLIRDGLDNSIADEFSLMTDDDQNKVSEMNTYIETKIKEQMTDDAQKNIFYTKNAIPKSHHLKYKASFLKDKPDFKPDFLKDNV